MPDFGSWAADWWKPILFIVIAGHLTNVCVTLFLHRAQTHRSVKLHYLAALPMRLWLWLSTAIVTKEWVACHRKHHAFADREGDPHSPLMEGLRNIVLKGAFYYRKAVRQPGVLEKYGKGTPNDWLERYVLSRLNWVGILLMLLADVYLFGFFVGPLVWGIQMIWIPFWAAGVVNGLGHFWGYRNFNSSDASTNLIPWGIIIGGEELHNNHHTYPTSAKFSVKKYEFDIGWVYISLMQKIGWAKVKKLPPKMQLGDVVPVANEKTLEAVIANRYEVMAGYAREMRRATREELAQLKAKGADLSVLKAAKTWLHRDDDKVPADARSNLVQARAAHPVLDKMVTMREELRQLWLNTSNSREQLAADLAAWCHRAEASGIAGLREFSTRLRAART